MKKHKSLFFKSATKKRLLWVYLVTSIPLLVCILLGSEYGKRLLRQQSIQYNHITWTRTPALPACFSIFRIRIS